MAAQAKPAKFVRRRKSVTLRQRMLRNWMLFALPWLAGVAAMSTYDHLRAIRRMVDLHVADQALAGMQIVGSWLLAVAHYAGEAVLLYGGLPVGLTFILYVIFLPWADRWSRQGLLED